MSEQVHALSRFHADLVQEINRLAKEHGLIAQPHQALLESDALFMGLCVTHPDSLTFFSRYWEKHARILGIDSEAKPGDRMICPLTAREWTLLGLDPMSERRPIRMMDDELNHHWIDIESFAALEVM